jgi:hypothetical protein
MSGRSQSELNSGYPADYGKYLEECFDMATAFVNKSYEEWKAAKPVEKDERVRAALISARADLVRVREQLLAYNTTTFDKTIAMIDAALKEITDRGR